MEDITGQKFGRLTAIRFVEKRGQYYYWLFKCDCENERTIEKNNVKSGKQKSCGCLLKENGKKLGDKNKTHGGSNSIEFSSWCSMLNRCYNVNYKFYKDYGGRGITVCDRWKNSFENFLEDMRERQTTKYSIERIDNTGNYTPENCKWGTKLEQANNRRNNTLIIYKGKSKTLAEWCLNFNLNYEAVRSRIKYKKWDINKALETPIGISKKKIIFHEEIIK